MIKYIGFFCYMNKKIVTNIHWVYSWGKTCYTQNVGEPNQKNGNGQWRVIEINRRFSTVFRDSCFTHHSYFNWKKYNLFKTFNNYTKLTSINQKATPSLELVNKVRNLYATKLPDVRFLIPILTGLTKVIFITKQTQLTKRLNCI